MSTFQKGDVVRLKSGGPTMTIHDLGDFTPEAADGALCVWFDDKKVSNQKVFDVAVLEKYVPSGQPSAVR